MQYVVEGTVQTAGDNIRVSASLVQSSDGLRLWSQVFDRRKSSAFSIQQDIGRAVAGALGSKLVGQQIAKNDLTENGDAYRNYIAAKAMLRTRNIGLASQAIPLLRAAVAADPDYAPAWARLAEATRYDAMLQGDEDLIVALPEAIGYVRRALALSPDLAEAHGILGALLGYRSAEAQDHLRRAAALGPRDPDAQLWLAYAEHAAGNFQAEMDAIRRANEIDPQSSETTRDLALVRAESGDRQGAAEAAARALQPSARAATSARIAWMFGDFLRRPSSGSSRPASRRCGASRRVSGLPTPATPSDCRTPCCPRRRLRPSAREPMSGGSG